MGHQIFTNLDFRGFNFPIFNFANLNFLLANSPKIHPKGPPKGGPLASLDKGGAFVWLNFNRAPLDMKLSQIEFISSGARLNSISTLFQSSFARYEIMLKRSEAPLNDKGFALICHLNMAPKGPIQGTYVPWRGRSPRLRGPLGPLSRSPGKASPSQWSEGAPEGSPRATVVAPSELPRGPFRAPEGATILGQLRCPEIGHIGGMKGPLRGH